MNTTLITGASSGIGEAFARRLAALGRNVFLVSRSEDKLVTLCNELGRTNRVRAQYCVLDLSQPESPALLFQEAEKRGLEVEMLINNAGFGSMGDFVKLDLARDLNMIDLNVKSLVELTHLFLGPMRARKKGSIINVASTAGFQPVPYMATYAATKAFVLTFSEAVHEENKPYGIEVLALCPGVTETNFFEASRGHKPPARVAQTPDEVVDTALRALGSGKGHVVSGWSNFLMIEAQRFVPRSAVVRLAGRMMRKSFGEKND